MMIQVTRMRTKMKIVMKMKMTKIMKKTMMTMMKVEVVRQKPSQRTRYIVLNMPS